MKKTIIKILIIALISLNINNTFADYKYKIEDRIRINHADEKVKKYLSNKKTAYYLAKKLKRKIEKLLNKTEKEIIRKYENRKSKYEDFKEYALTDIY
jgi:nitrous oxide reductase